MNNLIPVGYAILMIIFWIIIAGFILYKTKRVIFNFNKSYTPLCFQPAEFNQLCEQISKLHIEQKMIIMQKLISGKVRYNIHIEGNDMFLDGAFNDGVDLSEFQQKDNISIG